MVMRNKVMDSRLDEEADKGVDEESEEGGNLEGEAAGDGRAREHAFEGSKKRAGSLVDPGDKGSSGTGAKELEKDAERKQEFDDSENGVG